MVYLVRIVLRLGWKERSDKGEQQTYTDVPDYFHLDYYGFTVFLLFIYGIVIFVFFGGNHPHPVVGVFRVDSYGCVGHVVSSIFEGVAYDGVFAPFEVEPAESFAP